MSSRDEGTRGESAACDYLERQGYKVIERNFRTRRGEIDIIAEDEGHIIFVEVKTRTDTPALKVYGRPSAAVNRAKRTRLINTAKEYMAIHKTQKSPRIDVIELLVSRGGFVDIKINHIKAAVTESYT